MSTNVPERCLDVMPGNPGVACQREQGHPEAHAANVPDLGGVQTWSQHEELQEPHPPALVLDLAKTIDPDAWMSEASFFYEYRYDQKVGESHSRAIHWQGARRANSLDRARHVIDDVRRYDEAHHG